VAIRLERDDQRRWLVARVVGALTLEDALEFTETVRVPPATLTWPLLFDARGATSLLGDEDVSRLVNALARLRTTRRPPRTFAAMVSDNDALYAQFLAYEIRLNEIGVRTIRVFRRLADAESWLAVLASARHFGAGSI
jgi:hypothetical protein